MKVLPEEVFVGSPENVVSDPDSAKVVRRENRIQNNSPLPDRIELGNILQRYQVGDSMTVHYDVRTEFGSEGFIQRLDYGRNLINQKGPLTGTGSVQFDNLDQTDALIRGIVRNNDGLRVSALQDNPFVVGNQRIHPETQAGGNYEWADQGSQTNDLLATKDQQKESVELENEIASHVFDVLTGYDDVVNSVESHVGEIVGLDYNTVGPSEFQNSAQPVQSSFFPQSHRESYPLRLTGTDPLPYSTSAQSGSEKDELQNLSTTPTSTNPVTVTDRTREIDYQYESSSEVQERINEIDDVLSGGPLTVSSRSGINELDSETEGFNNRTELQKNYDAMYHWLKQYSHRGFGRKFQAVLNQQGLQTTQQKIDQLENDKNESYGAGGP